MLLILAHKQILNKLIIIKSCIDKINNKKILSDDFYESDGSARSLKTLKNRRSRNRNRTMSGRHRWSPKGVAKPLLNPLRGGYSTHGALESL